ncbi:polysaccharide biosynthesis protein [Paenibacillus andongensis]|uniref:polysaccharide biosynthesis protein n=1 Tax=Paenibacillus andongensis TaxID=2975482 RepID=UPI0021BB5D9D|nr:polysaccharide biosynthesis protein [Paenibacillus andongensis]
MAGFFHNKKILIIGGTGTIGQGLLKHILLENPAVVRIFSRDEHKQFELQQHMKDFTNIRYLIGDVRDSDRVLRAMRDIDYVFHVAAMKHVPFCEYNPFEAVQTNIIGTQNVIQASISAGVKKTIFTSTDKAIAPTNTYGASKLMAERLIASAQYNSGSHGTVFAAVRFGNVMGSRGSVIPLFINQIQKNRQISITDPTMTRFMMTQQQATSLTIKAMELANGGEIFVLKMPVLKLDDLANAVIELAAPKFGIDPSEVQIKAIGLRTGEKMFEELMTEIEAKDAIEQEDMFVIVNPLLDKATTHTLKKKAEPHSYSSHEQMPISKKEVISMVEEFLSDYTIYKG